MIARLNTDFAELIRAIKNATSTTPPLEYKNWSGPSTWVKLSRDHPNPVKGIVLRSNSTATNEKANAIWLNFLRLPTKKAGSVKINA